MATYCDPTSDSLQDLSCEFPDSRLLDLRKGTNPQFLAYQANRVRYQRTARMNNMARTCEGDLTNCHFTPITHKNNGNDNSGNPILIHKQALSDQPNYILQKGEYIPSGRLEVQRRTHLDYVASTDQGQTIGDSRQQDYFRTVQRDARQCLLYGTRCGALNNDGSVKSKLLPPTDNFGNTWEKDDAETLGDESNAQRGRETNERGGLGYDDSQNREK